MACALSPDSTLFRDALARLGPAPPERPTPTTRLERAPRLHHPGQPEQPDDRLRVTDAAGLGETDRLLPRAPFEDEPLVLVRPESTVLRRGRQLRREVQVHQLVGEAGRRVERRRASATCPPGDRSPPRAPAQPPTAGSSFDPSSREIEAPGRDLEQGIVGGEPPLADERDPTRRRRAATMATAPGWPAKSRVAREPSARSTVSTRNSMNAPAMDDAPVDDALAQVVDVCGPARANADRPRRTPPGPSCRWVGRSSVRLPTWACAWMMVSPDSGSNRWSFSSGITRLTMSPGRTRWSESTIATTSWSAALTWSSSSLPRYSTTSARVPGRSHARHRPRRSRDARAGSPRRPAGRAVSCSRARGGTGIDQSPGTLQLPVGDLDARRSSSPGCR